MLLHLVRERALLLRELSLGLRRRRGGQVRRSGLVSGQYGEAEGRGESVPGMWGVELLDWDEGVV